MVSGSGGLRFEHELASDIYEASENTILPIRAGWSGNQKVPAPDLLINDGVVAHALELKKTSDDTSCIVPREDIKDIVGFAVEYPQQTYPYLGIKFSYYQLALIPLYTGGTTSSIEDVDWDEILENAVQLSPLEASVTRKGNLSVRKPESGDEWPSVYSEEYYDLRDADYVLEALQIEKRNPHLLPSRFSETEWDLSALS